MRKIITSAFIALAACGSCIGDVASEHAFMWNEANAIAASARSQEDYRVAAQAYQALLDRGVRNGPLLYNLGTALLNAGDNANAVSVLLRAERYMGASPDLRHNLSIAFARREKEAAIGHPWHRALLFWHFKLQAEVRTAVAATAFLCFWVLLAVRTLGTGHWTRHPITVCALVFIIFGTSVVTSIHQESNAKRIVPMAIRPEATS